MQEWIRPVGSSDRWHLELVASPSGSRQAYCAFGYFEPGEALDERAFELPPDIEDRCIGCAEAYDRIPRIPSRRRLEPARVPLRGALLTDPRDAGVPERRR